MNIWECHHPDCTNRVVGVGGAIGLRAIGWYFELGPVLYCPNHYPQGHRESEISAYKAQSVIARSEGAIWDQDEIASEIRRLYPRAISVNFLVHANSFEIRIDTCERRGSQPDYNVKLNGQLVEDLRK